MPYEEDEKKKLEYFKALYKQLSMFCNPEAAQKGVRNKVIYILSTHMGHFSSFIFENYEKWHILLNNMLNESEIYTVKGALRSFYKIVVSELLKKDKEDVFLVCILLIINS